MNTQRLKVLSTLLLTLVLLPVSIVQAVGESHPRYQAVGTNLLQNPGFEGIGKPTNNNVPNPSNWTRDTFSGANYGEIFTPEGWVTWWSEGEYKRPECKVIPNEHPFNADPDRIYEGYYSGMCFTFFGKQNAGYYQVVRNIPPGSTVEGSFYAHAWACGEDETAYSCGDPHSFYFQVGLDPTGGTDPNAASVQWSSPYYYYDQFGKVGPLQATVGEAGVMTFFIRAYGKWQMKHNDAYMDNASMTLVSVGEQQPTEEPPPPTSETEEPSEPQQPVATSTPLPDGTIVHVVEEGDTLFAIAFTYGVDVDELRRLNAGTLGPDALLSIGQEIVISGDSSAITLPTPTATPQATSVPETQPTQAPETTPQPTTPAAGVATPVAATGDTASVCVLAYHDRNNDSLRQAESEELLPNATFNLIGTSGPAASEYTSDGISEPHCFESLAPGNYALRHTAPPGYQAVNGGQWNLPLGAGQVQSLELGYVRGETTDPGGDVSPDDSEQLLDSRSESPQDETEEEVSGLTRFLNILLRVASIGVLLIALGLGFLAYRSRN